jgi:uncharacterized protein (TIGR02118 family)
MQVCKETVMAQMVVVYKRPEDQEAFKRHYFEKHVPLAKALPGIRKYEVSYGPITSPSEPSDAWMIATLHFDDTAAIRDAFASDVGQACAADRLEFAPDPTSFQMFIFDNREV